MSENIYAPPESRLETAVFKTDLASRWSRLWASMIDSLTIMVITVPVMYFTGGFDDIMKGLQPPVSYKLTISLLGIAVFLIINTSLLINNGQTIGKKALGIKIVDINGNKATMKKHLLKRYFVFFVPGQIPIAGQLFSFVNILFIFGKQKRCIHDYVAGTKVING